VGIFNKKRGSRFGHPSQEKQAGKAETRYLHNPKRAICIKKPRPHEAGTGHNQ
jgi:hypothetical protein